jgi:hypothetical protein
MAMWRFKFNLSHGTLPYDVETDGTCGEALAAVLEKTKFPLADLSSVQEVSGPSGSAIRSSDKLNRVRG